MIRTSKRPIQHMKCQHIVDDQEVKEISRVMESLAMDISIADFAEAKKVFLTKGKCNKDAYFCLSTIWFCQAHYADHLKSPEYKKRIERAIGHTTISKSLRKAEAAEHSAKQLELDTLFAKHYTPKVEARVKGADGFHMGKKVG